jgi:hypothetical protein
MWPVTLLRACGVVMTPMVTIHPLAVGMHDDCI